MKSKNLEHNFKSELKTSLSFKFRFSFLVFCLSVSILFMEIAPAETQSEQHNSNELLVPHLAKISKSVNWPNNPGDILKDTNESNAIQSPDAFAYIGEPLMKIAEFPENRQRQWQTSPDFIAIAPLNFAAQVNEKLPESSFIIAGIPTSPIEQQLWQSRISISKDEKDNRSSNELKRIIEQIRSVEFEPLKKTPEPIIKVEAIRTPEPNESLSDSQVATRTKEKGTKFKQPALFGDSSQNISSMAYVPLSDQTLQSLKNMSQHPEQVDNPFELGEILFLSGYLKESAVFYQEALKRPGKKEAGSVGDKPWILFQIGNCLQNDDQSTAIKMYRQVITEYPDSPWADLAKTMEQLTDWEQKDNPRALIAENRF